MAEAPGDDSTEVGAMGTLMKGWRWPDGLYGGEFVAVPLGPTGVHRAGRFDASDDVVLARVGELPATGGLMLARNSDSYELGRLGQVDGDGIELWPLDPTLPARKLAPAGVVGAVILRWHADRG